MDFFISLSLFYIQRMAGRRLLLDFFLSFSGFSSNGCLDDFFFWTFSCSSPVLHPGEWLAGGFFWTFSCLSPVLHPANGWTVASFGLFLAFLLFYIQQMANRRLLWDFSLLFSCFTSNNSRIQPENPSIEFNKKNYHMPQKNCRVSYTPTRQSDIP